MEKRTPSLMQLRSHGAYSPDKALAHPSRMELLRVGKQPYPVHVQLIVSDLCNLGCPGCAYRMEDYSSNQLFGVKDPITSIVNNNPNRMLEPALVEKILDDCVEMGVKAVQFTGGGEPTVHPNIVDFLVGAQRRGLKTALVTNGLLLHAKPGLLEAAVNCQWVRISIDAASPEVFGQVRPGLGGPRGEQLFVALKNLAALRRLREERGADCTIGAGFVVQKENWHEMLEAARLYRDAGADNVRFSGLFTTEREAYFAGWREEAEALERTTSELVHEPPVFSVFARFHEKVDDLMARPTDPDCYYQQLTTYIGGDGNLYRCCVQAYNLRGLIGSVRAAGGLRNLWDSIAKQDNFDRFDARSCSFCQFVDRNHSLRAAVAADVLPTPPAGIIHPDFV